MWSPLPRQRALAQPYEIIRQAWIAGRLQLERNFGSHPSQPDQEHLISRDEIPARPQFDRKVQSSERSASAVASTMALEITCPAPDRQQTTCFPVVEDANMKRRGQELFRGDDLLGHTPPTCAQTCEREVGNSR